MGGAGSQRPQRHHALVAQGLLARGRQAAVAFPYRCRHARDEPCDHGRGNHEGQPHAGQVQSCGALGVGHGKRQELPHQQRVQRNGQHGDRSSEGAGQ
jgi:hypothetical protein